MSEALARELALAIERGDAKEAMCSEQLNGNWVANSHTRDLKSAAPTIRTPEIFRTVIVRLRSAG